MKVLHVLRDLSRNGGVQRLVADAVTAPGRTVQYSVLIYHDEGGSSYADEIRRSGVEVRVLQRHRLLAQWLYMRQFDVVHAHLFPALYLVALLHSRVIYTEHNTSNNRRRIRWAWMLESWIYKKYCRVTCISADVQHALLQFLRWPTSSHTEVVLNGVATAKFRRVQAETPVSTFNIGMVGSLTPKKDQACLIHALKLLPEQAHLHLVGDGPKSVELRGLSDSLGLKNRVHFHGVISDVPAFLSELQLYVQSSWIEGFGLAAVEAMAAGLPVLCADVPGLNNLADDRSILFPAGRSDALGILIDRAMRDADFLDQLRRVAARTADKYQLEHMLDAFEHLYKSVASNSSGQLYA